MVKLSEPSNIPGYFSNPCKITVNITQKFFVQAYDNFMFTNYNHCNIAS